MARPSLSLRIIPRFPAKVLPGDGIAIIRTGGSITIDMDWSNIAQASFPVDPSGLEFTLRQADGSFVRVPVEEIVLPQVTWDTLSGKPSEFPPSAHTHTTPEDVVRSILANAVRAIMLGLADDPAASSEALQYLVGSAPNMLNRLKISGANNGSHPLLEAVGFDDDISHVHVGKGAGGHIFGNGAGIILWLEDNASGNIAYNYFRVRGGDSGADPEIRSNRGARHRVSGTNAFTVDADGNPLFQVQRTGTATPRSLIVETNDTKVEIKTSAGTLTLTPAAGFSVSVNGGIRMGGRETRVYNAQNPASGTTITTTDGTPRLIVTTGGVTLASLTVVLPPNPQDGEVFVLCADCTITALTCSGGTGGADVSGNITTVNNTSPVKWIYYSVSNKWIRTL